MLISELIDYLERKKEEYGDIPIVTYDSSLQEYCSRVCGEKVSDDHFLDEDENIIESDFMVL